MIRLVYRGAVYFFPELAMMLMASMSPGTIERAMFLALGHLIPWCRPCSVSAQFAVSLSLLGIFVFVHGVRLWVFSTAGRPLPSGYKLSAIEVTSSLLVVLAYLVFLLKSHDHESHLDQIAIGVGDIFGATASALALIVIGIALFNHSARKEQ